MGNGRKQKGKPKQKGKRKLMKAKLAPKNETDAPEAKKQKVESQSVDKNKQKRTQFICVSFAKLRW